LRSFAIRNVIEGVFAFLILILASYCFSPVNSQASTIIGNATQCTSSSGINTYGNQDCSTGDISFLGKYVKLGLNNVGSLGTTYSYTSDYYTGQLGMIVDTDKNGFINGDGPTFGGDYVVASAIIEGNPPLLTAATSNR
jgi:hypothetical protein